MADKNVQLHDASGNDLYPKTKAGNLTGTLGVENGGTGRTDLADMVIEQGTSGFWTYRKWASGISECWGSTTFTDKCDSPWGALYESSGHYWSYPSGVFSAKPICQAFMYGTSQSAGMVEYITGGSATRTPQLYVCRPTSVGSQSWTVELYSIGRWK